MSFTADYVLNANKVSEINLTIFCSLISLTLIQSKTPAAVSVCLTYVLMFCLSVSAECLVCLDYQALLKKFSSILSLSVG